MFGDIPSSANTTRSKSACMLLHCSKWRTQEAVTTWKAMMGERSASPRACFSVHIRVEWKTAEETVKLCPRNNTVALWKFQSLLKLAQIALMLPVCTVTSKELSVHKTNLQCLQESPEWHAFKADDWGTENRTQSHFLTIMKTWVDKNDCWLWESIQLEKCH